MCLRLATGVYYYTTSNDLGIFELGPETPTMVLAPRIISGYMMITFISDKKK